MSLEIVFSDRAKESADHVYDFIEENFEVKAAISFKRKTALTLTQIAKFPYMFKASVISDDIRTGLITKQTSVIYQILEEAIFLHYFWDNRQEPFFAEESI